MSQVTNTLAEVLKLAVERLPRRIEPISGQRFSYVKLDDVLAIFEATSRDHAPSALQPEWQPIKNAPRDRRIEVRYLTDDPRPVQWMATDHGVGWHLANEFGAVPIEFDPTEWRDMVAPSAATTVEPVAIHPVEMDSQQIAQALDSYRRWTVLEPETHDLLNAAAQRLRATPPSSGNADAVREVLVDELLREAKGRSKPSLVSNLLERAAAALSSAPVAGEIELKVEQGGTGLWYATSDQIPGLFVAEQTHGLALNKVGHVLWNMQKARLLSRNDRGGSAS